MRVVVIGSGLLGVSSAYFLARAGAQVTVLDREAAPAHGTSFANSGMLTPSMADPWNAPGVLWHLLRDFGQGHAPLRLRPAGLPGLLRWGPRFIRHSSPRRYRDNVAKNLRLARWSLQTLRELRTQLGIDYEQRTAGTLRVYRDRASLDAGRARWDVLGELGFQPRPLSADEVVALEPALASVRASLVGGVHCTEDESGDARLFTEALARHAQGHGVRFLQGHAVTGFALRGGRLDAAMTAQGAQGADAFVLAAGCWSPLLLKPLDLKLPLRPVKGYSLTLQTEALRPFPQRPVIDDTLHAAVTPLGTRLRVAGLAEFAGYDRSIPDERLDTLLGFLRAIYPGVTPDRNAMQPWAGLRPVSADGVPFIGRLRYENLYLNTGHGHLGWTLAAGSARLLTELMMGTPVTLDADPYDPQRSI